MGNRLIVLIRSSHFPLVHEHVLGGSKLFMLKTWFPWY
jgi:hypothetical protein